MKYLIALKMDLKNQAFINCHFYSINFKLTYLNLFIKFNFF
jgi:hypothetical protein